MLLPSLVQVSESISGSVVPLVFWERTLLQKEWLLECTKKHFFVYFASALLPLVPNGQKSVSKCRLWVYNAQFFCCLCWHQWSNRGRAKFKKVCFLGHPNAYIPCDRQETMLTESGGLATLLSDHQQHQNQHQNQDQVATTTVISCHWKNALLSWGPCWGWGWDLKVVKTEMACAVHLLKLDNGGDVKNHKAFFYK